MELNLNEVKSQNGQRVCTRNKANKTSFLSVMGEKEHLDNDVPDNLVRPCYKHLITSCFSVMNIEITSRKREYLLDQHTMTIACFSNFAI